jgi:hypothetical protein
MWRPGFPMAQAIPECGIALGWFEETLKKVHDALSPTQRLLIEYKPFEPFFYHTDKATDRKSQNGPRQIELSQVWAVALISCLNSTVAIFVGSLRRKWVFRGVQR